MRVRRLSDTTVEILAATSLNLVLENIGGLTGGRGWGGSGPMTPLRNQGSSSSSSSSLSSPHAYLKRLASGRRALLQRAVEYCSRGAHARQADLLSVSFEGVPHVFRVGKTEPPLPVGRRHTTVPTTAVAEERAEKINDSGDGGDGDSLVAPLAELSISEKRVAAAESTPSKPVAAEAVSSTSAVAAPAAPAQEVAAEDGQGAGAQAAETKHICGGSGAKGNENDGASAAVVTAAARVRLEAFYREHNPDKLVGDDMDNILAKYAGREETLFVKLQKKYGASSSQLRTATSGGNTGTERQQQQQNQSPSDATPGTTEPAACSPFSGRQPLAAHDLERRTAGRRHSPATPAVKRQGSGGLTSDEAAGIRSWGASETLWFITADTSIHLSGADAPPPDDYQLAAAAVGAGSTNTFSLQGVDIGTSTGDKRSTQPRGEEGGRGTSRRIDGRDEGEEEDEGEWRSVGGLSSQIQQLREAIELPLRSPEVLRRYGVRPPRGVLLHGPPGTGKTTLARAAAKACGCHVIVVNGSELMSR